ncbi:MAG: hypothetical protein ACK51L_04745 [bacterium]
MWTSWRRKGAESGLDDAAYSPGRRRKKKPRRSMSAVAVASGEPRKWQLVIAWWMTGRGTGLTRVGGSSCLE